MSIPKIIHYCWFGKGEKNELVNKCIKSWEQYCPDYKIIEWNEMNYNILTNKYVRDAYKEKKWAFVSDYVRTDVIYKYGGIYLDTDVEVINPLERLLDFHAFFGVESQNLNINTGLGFGAEQYNDIVKKLRDMYDDISFYKKNGELNLTSCPIYITKFFEELGYIKNNKIQTIRNIEILPSDRFSPYDYKTGKINLSKDTFSIHWYNASWFDEDDKKIHDMEVNIQKKINSKIALVFCFIYRKLFRVIMALKRGELIKLFKRKLKKG